MTKAMKIILLSPLFWLPLLSAHAQRQLPRSLQQHPEQMPAQATLLLQKAGFRIQPGAGTTDRSVALQLDSTLQFIEYSVPAADDSIPALRTTYQYPQPNVKVESEFQYDNGSWLPLTNSTINSDALGRITDVFAETYDATEGMFIPDSRLKVFPHGNSLTLFDSTVVLQWQPDNNTWVPLLAISNVFDAQDRLIETYTSFDAFGTSLLQKDVIQYDANGDPTLEESFTLLGGFEFPSGKITRLFENHRLREEIKYVTDGIGGYLPQQRTSINYNTQWLPSQVKEAEWDAIANDWNTFSIALYTYDAQQRLSAVETHMFNTNGTVISKTRNTYVYQQDEYLALESLLAWDGTSFHLSNRKYYFYQGAVSGTDQPLGQAELRVWPNPFNAEVRLQLEETAQVRLYNTRGELLRALECQPNAILQLGELPAGVYVVQAYTPHGAFSSRLLKQP
jgi:hypothetical protein